MTTDVRESAEPLSPNNRIVLGGLDGADVDTLKDYLAEIDCVTKVVTLAKDIFACVEQWQPALLLLNPMIAHGFDVCRKMKDDREQRRTMVIMVADLKRVSDIERAVEAGTDDFIGQPIVKSELLKRVRNMLALRRIIDEQDRLR